MNFAAVNSRSAARYYTTLSATVRSRCALPLDLRTTGPSRTMATKTAIYSEGEDAAKLQHDVEPLLVDGGGQWTLSQSRKGLERQFRFKTFKKTWEFMDAVASKSAKERHHPEWSNIYNKVFIRWTTHSPSGLSSKDVRMAQFCDDEAKSLGVVEETRLETKLEGLLEPLVK